MCIAKLQNASIPNLLQKFYSTHPFMVVPITKIETKK